jgi:hypothetical protein
MPACACLGAPLLPVDQSGVVQDFEVMADCRLGQVELAPQVAGADLAAGMGGRTSPSLLAAAATGVIIALTVGLSLHS